MALRKIAFVLEEFIVSAPSQQLLDRFLIGYLRDGEFRRIPNLGIAVWLAPAAENSTALADATTGLAVRQRDFKLVSHSNVTDALKDAEAVVAIAARDRVSVGEDLLKNVLEQAPIGAACFVHGCLATNLASAQRLVSIAAARKLAVAVATSVSTTFRLPEVDVAANTPLAEALIVVQGPRPLAELSAIDGLLPVVARRKGGESRLRSVRRLQGREVWRAGDKGEWSWPLLSAAISRSNTTQGDPVRDGRTQDLVGLGLVRKLARDPRGWIIEHTDGLRSTILVLDGVVADINFAVRSRDGSITSAQLYRPPAPNRAEFDRLAAVLEDFFTTRSAPWPIERSLLVSQFMQIVTA
ncbi:MAG TPA: hypothetical protein VNT99_12545 [Methylomirabilota bacterium]|nr:hypothetical protein [Methylomirabilota bacterium]